MSPVKMKKRDFLLKNEVIHIRTAPTDKSLIEGAADAVGLTLSSFILQSALRAARREMAEIEKISFSKKDAEIFFTTLMNPNTPNEALKSAFKEHEKQIKK